MGVVYGLGNGQPGAGKRLEGSAAEWEFPTLPPSTRRASSAAPCRNACTRHPPMKALARLLLATGSAGFLGAHGQTSPPPPTDTPTPALWVVTELGPHSRSWARVASVTNPAGRAFLATNTITELQTGLGVLEPATRAWRESSPAFAVSRNGYAIATNCQHWVIIGPNLNAPEGVVDLQFPGGTGRLRGGAVALVGAATLAQRHLAPTCGPN